MEKEENNENFHFRIKYEVKFGESIYVIGNIPELGNWEI